MSAVVDGDDFDFVPMLYHLQLFQILHQLQHSKIASVKLSLSPLGLLQVE
jgi:hypothetical protein